MTRNALVYSWHQLAQRAGVEAPTCDGYGFEFSGISVRYRPLDPLAYEQPGIVVVPCSDAAWRNLLDRRPQSLDWLPVSDVVPPGIRLPLADLIPVLFWGEGCEDGTKPFAELQSNRTVVFYADIVASTFFMLSRWEETVVGIRDRHDRVPATSSVACKQGFLDRPIIDEYGLILRAWLRTLLPRWHPKRRRFCIRLSHDIDRPLRLRTPGHVLRAAASDTINFRSLKRVLQTLARYPETKRDWYSDDYAIGFYELMELSERFGLQSTFNFMASTRSRYDDGYDPRKQPYRQMIEDVQTRGHEIGLHPGYATYRNKERLLREKARLDEVLQGRRYGSRQHMLRFSVPETWWDLKEVGLSYDSTLGYADYVGFRCGTCHPFQPYDCLRDTEIGFLEIPLIVMDSSLHEDRYMALTPQEGEQRIHRLVQSCKAVEGNFTLLWHNSSLNGKLTPWGEMYRKLIPALAEAETQNDHDG